jgi:TM2 domain-containing membrane protein YozV
VVLETAFCGVDKTAGQAFIEVMTAGQGSAGNVISALASLFIPGLGQLLQGRFLAAVLFFVGAAVLWFISIGTLGWIMHLWSCLNAALWKPS